MLLIAAEAVGLIEFVAELRGAQIFAQMSDALLERRERGLDCFSVGVGDVAPHGKRAGAEPRHLAECAAANIFQLWRVANFFFEQRAQRSGDKLGQMADPGDQLVVTRGIEIECS